MICFCPYFKILGCGRRKVSDLRIRSGAPPPKVFRLSVSRAFLSRKALGTASRQSLNIFSLIRLELNCTAGNDYNSDVRTSSNLSKNNPLSSWTTRTQKCVKPCSSGFVRSLGIPITKLALEISHSRTLRTSGCSFSSINFSRHLSQAVIIIVRRRRASLR